MGHKVLETFYRTGLDTPNKREWYDAAIAEIERLTETAIDEEDLEITALVSDRFNKYVRHYRDDWRIVDVEGKYQQHLEDDITYGMTLDLLIEEQSGAYRGQYIVIDHKWCYNFQTPDELMMNSQIPKYIATLRNNGFNVTRGMLNLIRYRSDIKDTDKLFKRSPLKPTDLRVENIMREQVATARLVRDRILMPVADYRDIAKRSMNKRNCGSCHFRLPCSLELDGRDKDASTALAVDYVENTYGYRG